MTKDITRYFAIVDAVKRALFEMITAQQVSPRIITHCDPLTPSSNWPRIAYFRQRLTPTRGGWHRVALC